MSDFFANGAQLPNVATNAQVENAENANFLRMFFRNSVLVARRQNGEELQLSQREPRFSVRGVQTGRLIIISEQLTTNASGLVTYTFPISFQTTPVVSCVAIQSNATTPTVAEIVSFSNTAVTARASRGITRVSANIMLFAIGLQGN